ncbi:MAG: histidinol-phosphatase [Anaerolineaceae bacterium]
MNTHRAELHVHTVLSPCAEVEMIPPLIVESSLDLGINLIAITDHNASANVSAVQKAAENTPLIVLPGMELQTVEEVHCLCLFDRLDSLLRFQTIVAPTLPHIQNQPDHFGGQFVVDETGDFIRHEDQLLIVSSSLTINAAFNLVSALGGLFIPAHVNRKAFGLLEILGFVPNDIPLEVLEVSRNLQMADAIKTYPQLTGFPLIRSGDAHRLDELLGANEFILESPTINEIRMAIRNIEGRSLKVS